MGDCYTDDTILKEDNPGKIFEQYLTKEGAKQNQTRQIVFK